MNQRIIICLAIIPFLVGSTVIVVAFYHGAKWLWWRGREYTELPGYVELSAKCEPFWNDTTHQYPYGPLGFRCDFRTLDDYIVLGDKLRAESKNH